MAMNHGGVCNLSGIAFDGLRAHGGVFGNAMHLIMVNAILKMICDRPTWV